MIYRVNARVVFRDGKGTRAGTLKRIIPARDAHGHDKTKALLETTFVDMTGVSHTSTASILYSAIVGLQEQEKREVAP